MAYKDTLFNTEVLKEKLLLCAKEIELLLNQQYLVFQKDFS